MIAQAKSEQATTTIEVDFGVGLGVDRGVLMRMTDLVAHMSEILRGIRHADRRVTHPLHMVLGATMDSGISPAQACEMTSTITIAISITASYNLIILSSYHLIRWSASRVPSSRLNGSENFPRPRHHSFSALFPGLRFSPTPAPSPMALFMMVTQGSSCRVPGAELPATSAAL